MPWPSKISAATISIRQNIVALRQHINHGIRVHACTFSASSWPYPSVVCTPGANYGIGRRPQAATLNCCFLYRPDARSPATALLQPVLPRRQRIAFEDGTSWNSLAVRSASCAPTAEQDANIASLTRTIDGTWKLPIGCEATAPHQEGPRSARQLLRELSGPVRSEFVSRRQDRITLVKGGNARSISARWYSSLAHRNTRQGRSSLDGRCDA